ncbi:hypothetical protein [Caballeronia sp. HLA56]
MMVEDKQLNAAQVDEDYNSIGDGEHFAFGLSEWRIAVGSKEIPIDYWDGVEYQIEKRFADATHLPNFLDSPDPGPALRHIIVETIAESSADKTPSSKGEFRTIYGVFETLTKVNR